MTTGGAGQTVGNHADVLDIVGDRTRTQGLVRRAAAMAAKAGRQSAITLVGEEVQEIFIPTPCRMPGPVDEEQRDRVGGTDRRPCRSPQACRPLRRLRQATSGALPRRRFRQAIAETVKV